jgi:hypothetical protein
MGINLIEMTNLNNRYVVHQNFLTKKVLEKLKISRAGHNSDQLGKNGLKCFNRDETN